MMPPIGVAAQPPSRKRMHRSVQVFRRPTGARQPPRRLARLAHRKVDLVAGEGSPVATHVARAWSVAGTHEVALHVCVVMATGAVARCRHSRKTGVLAAATVPGVGASLLATHAVATHAVAMLPPVAVVSLMGIPGGRRP